MMSSWWLLWILVMFIVLAPPVGYGWGYRRWGPPYPRYIQRRRAAKAGPATFNHQSWGWGGDFVWLVMIVGSFWVFAALWWR